DALSALVQANRGMPWLDWWDSREGNAGVVCDSLARESENKGFWAGVWSEGRLAGLVGLNGVNLWNRTASLDYWLGSAFQGKGLMTRAARAVVRHAFEEMGLNRVEIRCAAANRKSRAV